MLLLELLCACFELSPYNIWVLQIWFYGPFRVAWSVGFVHGEPVEGSVACEGSAEVFPGLEVLPEPELQADYGFGNFFFGELVSARHG